VTARESGSVFHAHRARVLEAFAAAMHVTPRAFLDEQLTVSDRSPEMNWCTAMVATFGTGTVIAIDPAYRAFIEANPPKPHYRAHYPDYLGKLSAEAARRDQRLSVSSPSMLWILSSLPPEPTIPAGFTMQVVDAEWMLAEMPNHRFENGVGDPAYAARDIRNRFACVLFDDTDQPAAVGGAFDTFGLLEVGVDVLRDHRRKGLGTLIVAAITREILDRGGTPFYGCASTNIRSQHTALAAGYLPVASDVFVIPLA
jgi:GNAT superfamily N-acetyltransferase